MTFDCRVTASATRTAKLWLLIEGSTKGLPNAWKEKRFSMKISRSVATGALPILFGDVRRGYLINDRTGLRIFCDPYTAKALRIFLLHEASRGG
jgi:hypothetical protein